MLLHVAVVAVVSRKMLERQCGECGKKNVFPPNRSADSVFCPQCGASIPPKDGQKAQHRSVVKRTVCMRNDEEAVEGESLCGGRRGLV